MLDLSTIQWLILAFSALNVGFAKTGLQGATLPAVILMASAFGGRLSSAIMLVMLIVGDLLAVRAYGKKINIRKILLLMPATLIGVILGTFIGNYVNDEQFKSIMAVLVFISIAILIFQEFNKSNFVVPQNKFISTIVGILSGLSSMIGNASGPLFNVFVLSLNLKKEEMISSIAWFFVFLNVIKLPFHIFVWETFSLQTILIGAIAIPGIFIGARFGIWLVARLDDLTYRKLMVGVTLFAAINLIL